MQMIARQVPTQNIQRLYERHRAELCFHVSSKVGLSEAQAEDVVHCAFEKLVQDKAELSSIKNPRAYLYKVCMNLAVDTKRRSAVRQRYAENTAQQVDVCAPQQCDPESSADAAQQLSVVAKAIAAMTAKRKRLLLMNRVDGLSYSEIGRREGISEAAVRKHIVKALLECQDAIDQGRSES